MYRTPFGPAPRIAHTMGIVCMHSCGPWTRALHTAATNPATASQLTVQVDAFHGSLDHTAVAASFPTVLLIAGGVGITPLLSLCRHLLHLKLGGELPLRMRRLHLLWVCREASVVNLLQPQLRAMVAAAAAASDSAWQLSVSVYITEEEAGEAAEQAGGEWARNALRDGTESPGDDRASEGFEAGKAAAAAAAAGVTQAPLSTAGAGAAASVATVVLLVGYCVAVSAVWCVWRTKTAALPANASTGDLVAVRAAAAAAGVGVLGVLGVLGVGGRGRWRSGEAGHRQDVELVPMTGAAESTGLKVSTHRPSAVLAAVQGVFTGVATARGGLAREVERALPSNSPRDQTILRVELSHRHHCRRSSRGSSTQRRWCWRVRRARSSRTRGGRTWLASCKRTPWTRRWCSCAGPRAFAEPPAPRHTR
jgi:hypothetical protein